MRRARLEAFSDGVIAIIITIMVLELRAPHGPDLGALRPLLPVFLSYVMSFVYVGIYWSNHHHLLQTVERVTGGMLWANLHFLFWLSLVPFVTAWLGENGGAWPTALYGIVMLLAGAAYWILERTIVACHGRDSTLASAVGRDMKAGVSIALYAAAVALAFVSYRLSAALYASVALMWLVPDRRIEAATRRADSGS